ncbi:hypothetical protein EV385_5037 [Krasilnikovia cinnamomea]|uniref:Uncharacterized protein n=1 Tax=Krasilnikovia cinnamomea TaxID=349313 RepID=A0A4Q7ZQW0_9ACTN|nr:hypothetical protein [Krasilnikovia cinnamomea]RZU53151.1 hypothetical protein EV385_5037 [Krasilnikovia cinnamomea]
MSDLSKPVDEGGAPRLVVSSFVLWAGAAVFLACSAFLLHTLVLEERHIPYTDYSTRIEDAGIIGAPALVGLLLAVTAAKRLRRR